MRRAIVCMFVVCLAMAGTVSAQEHYTQGPVWECSAYRTLPGKWDAYMTYLRANIAAIRAEAKEQGLVVDDRVFVQTPSDPTDWDVMFCTAYKDGAAAFDYDADIEAKWEAIAAKHLKTSDEDEQRAMAEPRFEMRTFLGTNMMREIELKPIEK
jgi:hypothetical protein